MKSFTLLLTAFIFCAMSCMENSAEKKDMPNGGQKKEEGKTTAETGENAVPDHVKILDDLADTVNDTSLENMALSIDSTESHFKDLTDELDEYIKTKESLYDSLKKNTVYICDTFSRSEMNKVIYLSRAAYETKIGLQKSFLDTIQRKLSELKDKYIILKMKRSLLSLGKSNKLDNLPGADSLEKWGNEINPVLIKIDNLLKKK